MSKRKILTYLYFAFLFLDVFGVLFPAIIDRKYTTFLPLPVLLILYFVSVKRINWYYVIALVFTFLGVIFFYKRTYFEIGLVSYAAGVLFYVIISLKQATVISIKSVCIAIVPFLIIYLVPLILYSDAVGGDVFNYIMLYVFFVGFFFLISSLIYINQSNKRNLWLLISGMVFVVSTIMHGYNLFFGYVAEVKIGVIITFLLMHYAMYRYVELE
ncbi:hypothetical protein IMCC3317_01230 [Kordia antarctica]|uniref:YhhN-like protein n=1 Tax=Kordia antarctica TaxID=1218801 RepID=A0A7L4ZDY2_9FLAO|nr:lysoplasmalogenase family protein [Kordia antarctica]QHI34779.1 hypothetical protein IMCC3317_01230 [Kordia antarctica]